MRPEDARNELDASTLRPGDASEASRALAAGDAELQQWLEKRSQFDEQVAGALGEIPVPAGLNDDILKAMEMERDLEPSVSKRRVGMLPLLLTMAVVIALAGVWWWNDAGGTGKDWERQALSMVKSIDSHEVRLDRFSGDLALLKASLKEVGSPMPEELPDGFAAMRSLGCKVFEVEGRPASVICFEIAPGQEAHLVMVGVEPGVPEAATKFESRGEWQVATWNKGGQRYMLATKASEEVLKGVFATLMDKGSRSFLIV